MAPKPETQRRDKRVIARLKRGDAAADVAADFGITISRVYQIKSEAAMREGLLAKVDSDKGRNETILELSAYGMPPGQIAQRIGLTPSRVNQIIAAERKNLPIVERNRHIIEAARNGEGRGAIAKRWNIHISGVNRIINKLERSDLQQEISEARQEIQGGLENTRELEYIMVPRRLSQVLAACLELAVSIVALSQDDALNLVRARTDDLAALHRLLTDASSGSKPTMEEEPALSGRVAG